MNPKTAPDRFDYEEYLIRIYFGSDTDLINNCINRAYRDFSRTFYGFEKDRKKEIYNQASDLLKKSLDDIKSKPESQYFQDIFDVWHTNTCNKLIDHFNVDSKGYQLHAGQAQKWINMTLKYIFTFGEDRISGYSKLFPYCHAPVDNILLDALEEKLKNKGFSKPKDFVWSKSNYQDYMQIQQSIRENFPGEPSLYVEFKLWMG